MLNRFIGTVDPNAAGASASAYVFASLVSRLFKVADACQRFAKISNFVRLYTAAFFKQRLSIAIPIISVGRGKSQTGDDDSLIVREVGGTIGGDHVRQFISKRRTSPREVLAASSKNRIGNIPVPERQKATSGVD